MRVTGLDQGLSQALERWRPSRAVHDPGKIMCDLAVMLALGGDCLADIAILRAAPELFGSIPSDPTVSRLSGRCTTGSRPSMALPRRLPSWRTTAIS
ncbi:hypothetical protein GCM10010151_10170 [Actinoallomurus spadix]|uniref:Transposase DDE domain-containing protein n=1 Tax=Actinoallomurus spadix TaxID=79912 RepID=A0ABP3FNV2_9ACTN